MNNEEFAEKIIKYIDNEVMNLGDDDWLEVLGEVQSNLKIQMDAKLEERDNS